MIKLKEWFYNLFCPKTIVVFRDRQIKQPKKLGNTSYGEVLSLLKNHTKDIYLSDMEYSLTSIEEAIKYSKETKIDSNKWLKEKYDCDEFSFGLMGYWNKGLEQFCFGVAWSRSHAFNIMIDDKKQIWIIEPQTNMFYKLENVKKNKSYYPMRLILI